MSLTLNMATQRAPHSQPDCDIHFRGACSGEVSQVQGVNPPQTLQNVNNLCFRLRVVPAEENIMISICYVLRIHHDVGINRVQRLDNFYIRKGTLDLFIERTCIAHEKGGPHACREIERYGYIHRILPFKFDAPASFNAWSEPAPFVALNTISPCSAVSAKEPSLNPKRLPLSFLLPHAL